MTKTDQILSLTAPFDNRFQGTAMRALFVCSVGMLRSPTAAVVATKLGLNARSCGSCVNMALIPISANLVFWATRIYFMNKENFLEAQIVFAGERDTLEELKDKAVVWNIEDDFEFMHPKLVSDIEILLTT